MSITKKINKLLGFIITISLITSALTAGQLNKMSQDIQNLALVKKLGFTIKQTEVLQDGLVHSKAIANGRHLDLYLSKDYKTLIIGDGFKTKTQEKIFFKVDMSVYEKDASFKIGTGKKKVYLFTDPECPYCKNMEKSLSKYFKDATFYVYLFNLPFHKKAIPMSRYILAQKSDKDKWKALESTANNSSKYEVSTYTSKQIEAYRNHFERMEEIVTQIGVTGTPSLLSAEGQMIQLNTLSQPSRN